MADDKKKQNVSDLVDGGVRPPCCYNCKHLGCVTERDEVQPYIEIWCKKGVWDGVEDKETLLLETDCNLHKRVD